MGEIAAGCLLQQLSWWCFLRMDLRAGLAGVGRVLLVAGTAVLWCEYPPRLALVGVEGVGG